MKGRMAIHEVFFMNEEIQQLIVGGESSVVIRQAARAHGMITLREVAAIRALEGVTTVAEMIAFINTSGLGAVGTPDMCREQIDRLIKQSNGGFGAYLLLAHEWANPEATRRNYELIARHVMPQFQGQALSTLEAKGRAEAVRPVLAAQQASAVEAMTQKYKAERQAGH